MTSVDARQDEACENATVSVKSEFEALYSAAENAYLERKEFSVPPLNIPERDSVRCLSEALDQYLLQLQSHRDRTRNNEVDYSGRKTQLLNVSNTGKSTKSVYEAGSDIPENVLRGRRELQEMVATIAEEESVFDLVFRKIIDQVSSHTRERGEILSKIRRYYKSALARMPARAMSIQSRLEEQVRRVIEMAAGRESDLDLMGEVKADMFRYKTRCRHLEHDLKVSLEVQSKLEDEVDDEIRAFGDIRKIWRDQRADFEKTITLLKTENLRLMTVQYDSQKQKKGWFAPAFCEICLSASSI
eukprot:332378_1